MTALQSLSQMELMEMAFAWEPNRLRNSTGP